MGVYSINQTCEVSIVRSYTYILFSLFAIYYIVYFYLKRYLRWLMAIRAWIIKKNYYVLIIN